MNNLNVQFDDIGLVIGLIKYPFKDCGKELYKSFVEKLFKAHRENIASFTDSEVDEFLYSPKGYRLFGNRGLAILSLIDDYAFPNRIFNSNHHHVLDKTVQYDAKIITGIAVSESGGYLKEKAGETFLMSNEEQRFPFIGIMRMKVEHRLLQRVDGGIHLTQAIKKEIEHMVGTNYDHVKCFVVECFDNDEMAVLAFSHDMLGLYNFLHEIRCLKHDKLEMHGQKKYKDQYGCEKEKHVFSSCHVNLGYDVEFSFEQHNPTFLEPVISEDLYVELLYESKPGHDHQTLRRLLSALTPISTHLTGGNKECLFLEISKIHELEQLCHDEERNDEQKLPKHVRGVEISLCHNRSISYGADHEPYNHVRESPVNEIGNSVIDGIKTLMNKHGVAKVVRERLLNLYRLYNDHCNDLLHATYLEELKGALESMEQNLKDLFSNEEYSIRLLNEKINQLITVIEEAIYNRVHIAGLKNANLEYNGGVQQHLTGYDFAYKNIVKMFSSSDEPFRNVHKSVFVNITGAAKEHSTAVSLQLNINQVIYPELFAYSVWKEAANYALQLYEKYYDVPIEGDHSDAMGRLQMWRQIVKSDYYFRKILFNLNEEGCVGHRDETYAIVHELLDKTLLEYFILDQVTFHFGYQRNYELFRHFVWKAFLQSGSCFSRKDEVSKIDFVRMLLRMVMVALNNGIKGDDEILCRPFDSVFAPIWCASYPKVLKCVESILLSINRHEFTELCENLIAFIENQLAETSPYLLGMGVGPDDSEVIMTAQETNGTALQMRHEIIGPEFKDVLAQKHLVTSSYLHSNGSPDYIICLLNAFLLQVMEYDGVGEIKHVPRGREGKMEEVLDIKRNEECTKALLANMIQMPADPLGGSYIPDFKMRKEYFALSTAFTKSLWHYKMVTS